MSINDQFDSVLERHLALGLLKRMTAARLTSLLNDAERNKRVVESSAIVGTLASASVCTGIRGEMLETFHSLNTFLIQDIADIEKDFNETISLH
jgi:hypothetical protein